MTCRVTAIVTSDGCRRERGLWSRVDLGAGIATLLSLPPIPWIPPVRIRILCGPDGPSAVQMGRVRPIRSSYPSLASVQVLLVDRHRTSDRLRVRGISSTERIDRESQPAHGFVRGPRRRFVSPSGPKELPTTTLELGLLVAMLRQVSCALRQRQQKLGRGALAARLRALPRSLPVPPVLVDGPSLRVGTVR